MNLILKSTVTCIILFGILLTTPVLMPELASAEDKAELKIGLIQSLTGIAAEDGVNVRNAVEFAVDKINKQGPLIKVITEDDRSESKSAVSAFMKLVSLDKVDIIIGPTWSFTIEAVLPLAAREKRVLFSTSGLYESLNLHLGLGYGFTNCNTVASEAAVFEEYLNTYEAKKVTVAYANNSWGEAQRDAYRKVLLKKGVEILDEIKLIMYDANDWLTLMPRIKRSKPDLILLLLNRSDVENFLRRSAEIQLKANFFSSKNAFDALRFTKQPSLFEGVHLTYAGWRLRSMSEFSEPFALRYGEKPRIYADTSYDAVNIIWQGHLISKAENIPLVDALKKVRHKGLAADYSWNPETSFSAGEVAWLKISGGEVVEVK